MINIFYIGESDFSRKVASSVRIINNCRALRMNGHITATIIGYSDFPIIYEDELVIMNVKRGKSWIGKLFCYLFRSFYFIQLINKIRVKNEGKDVIIYYGTSTRILLPLFYYCKLKKIKLVVDVVEWYEYSNLPFGRYGPIAWDVHFCLTQLIPRCDGAIVISSYLQRYFNNRGMKTIRIPVLINPNYKDISTEVNPQFDPKYLNLIYAGTPEKKDLLLTIIEAVEQLSSKGLFIRFHLLGPTQQQLLKIVSKTLSDAIVCYGRIPQEKVYLYLQQADFSVLLRPNMRYAHAGFPTKFVESLNAGLPVIANFTSDLELYLKDGYNGFVVDEISVDALVRKIQYVRTLNRDAFRQLKQNARESAMNNFDFKNYSEDLERYMLKV